MILTCVSIKDGIKSLAGPADGTIFLFDCPVPNAETVEDVSAFQQNCFLTFKVLEANAAVVLIVLISKRFVVNIDPLLSLGIRILATINMSIQVI